ncbi:putative fad binding domain-containing protein [Diplodia seriata]|uniref:Putative fad binding domain-containing protein n=1 Tax=Diplodia seriata TaxID=420778 RepID=A0A0G2ECH9_9PEZI|nr:putative fad binding domain-containing protein [Diplodia seriata]
MPPTNIIISGAGPSGLLLALLLARHPTSPQKDPITITLFDAASGLDPRPAVRRKLFGEKAFPGRTWDEQIVAANVYYDFTRWGYTDIQFFIHPEHWHMVARLAGPPKEYWRVSYGERSGLSHDELLERLPAKFAAMLPGNPQPGDYELAGFSPYRVHQRLAPSMRVGRIMLAADAAHLCNPFGGLGLTGGIVDVGGLYDCLAGIHDGLADESILDIYSDVRRRMWTDIVDPVSSDNIRRLFGQDPDRAAETDDFIKLINVAEKDERVRDELRAVSAILCLFFVP